MTAFGEVLPNHDNKVTLDKTSEGQVGPAGPRDGLRHRPNEKRMRKDMANDAAEMLEAAGVKNVKTHDNGYALGQGIHEMGTARMGRDPKTSVLNKHNQVWDAPNVFVTDGACMASSSCVNPSLTYMAMTARAANFAVEALKKGDV
jgi:choline dehydrogenase-like flavoprotein